MVIGPLKPSQVKKNSAHALREKHISLTYKRLAHPVDRLAATVIDLVIIGFIAGLFTSLFQREFQIAKITGEEIKIFFWAFSIFGFSLLIGVLYQSILISLRGTTIGKAFFRIRVEDRFRRKRIRFNQAFIRAILWWCELIFLGLPNLAIFTNKLRRPIHDRIADTICVTSSSRFVGEPKNKEKHFVTGIVSPIYVLAFFLVLAQVYAFYRYAMLEPSWQQELLVDFPSCEEVTKASRSWNEGESKLQIAMSLYAAESVSADCLEKETQYSFFMEQELALAYLAKAFIFIDEPLLSNDYLAAICKYEPGSSVCEFSKLIINDDLKNEEQSFYEFAHDGDSFSKIWAIKKLVNNGSYDLATSLMQDLPKAQQLASFRWTYEVKALHGMNKKQERDAVYTAVKDYIHDIEEFYIDTYICQSELFSSCNSESSYCKRFEKSASKDGFDGNLAIVTFAKIKHCQGEVTSKINYLRYSLLSPNPVLKELQAAYYSAYGEQDTSGFKAILAREEKGSDLWTSALYELASIYESEGDLVNTYDEWVSNRRKNQLWYLVGEKLAEKFLQGKNFVQALAVSRELLHLQPNSSSARKSLILSAHFLGLPKVAKHFANKQVLIRSIASQGEHSEILKKYGVYE